MTRSGAVPTRQLAAYHCAAYHCAAYHCAAYHWAANRMIPTVKARLQRGAVVLRKKTGQEFGDCVAAGSSCRLLAAQVDGQVDHSGRGLGAAGQRIGDGPRDRVFAVPSP
jgi:hypothetical protein